MNEKLGEVIKQDLYSILLNNWQIYCVACLSSVTRKESDTKFFCNVIKFWYVLMHWHAWTLNKSGNLNNWGRRIIMLWFVPPFHTPRSRGKNLQATRCVLGGKSRVKAVTLFLTPLFRPTPNEAKGGRPY